MAMATTNAATGTRQELVIEWLRLLDGVVALKQRLHDGDFPEVGDDERRALISALEQADEVLEPERPQRIVRG